MIKNQACSWCGSTKYLQVHHTFRTRTERRSLLKPIIQKLIEEKMLAGDLTRAYKERVSVVCLRCGADAPLPRRRSYKTWPCASCGASLDLIKTPPVRTQVLDLFLGDASYRAFRERYAAEIEARAAAAGVPPEPDYMDLDKDTLIICRRCHAALNHGKDLCPKCRQHYKPPSRPTCYQCLPERARQRIEAGLHPYEDFDDE